MSGWLRYRGHLSSPNRRRRSATHERSASPLSRRLRLEPLEDRRLLTLAVPGDCNVDANVDAADYVVWRKTLGKSFKTTSTRKAH